MKIIHLELQAGGYSTPEWKPPYWNLKGPMEGNKGRPNNACRKIRSLYPINLQIPCLSRFHFKLIASFIFDVTVALSHVDKVQICMQLLTYFIWSATTPLLVLQKFPVFGQINGLAISPLLSYIIVYISIHLSFHFCIFQNELYSLCTFDSKFVIFIYIYILKHVYHCAELHFSRKKKQKNKLRIFFKGDCWLTAFIKNPEAKFSSLFLFISIFTPGNEMIMMWLSHGDKAGGN